MRSDLRKHMIAGMGIYLATFAVILVATGGQVTYIYPAIACLLAGLGKEIYDAISDTGTCEGIDVLFTCIGGCIGATIVAVLSTFFA
jgi:hypothetical protein